MNKKIMILIPFLVLGLLLIVFIPSEKVSNTVKPAGKVHKTSGNVKSAHHIRGNTNLKDAIDAIIKGETALDRSLIGINIRSSDTGEVIYDYNGKTRMNPASNMKLLTAAAALSTLGEDYTFTTDILADGKVKADTLQGDLYIKGKGDPTILPSDFAHFASKLQKQGIKKINGDLIGDDTWYDDERLSPGLVWSDEDYYYGSQISALNAAPDKDYDTGAVIVEVSPGKEIGSIPNVHVTPENSYVTVKNDATTTNAAGEHDIEVKRKHGTNTITIEGTIPINSWNTKEWMAVWNPTGYALHLFKQALDENDIALKGSIKEKETPDDADVLLSHESMPLKDLLVPFMKLSNNSHAEVFVKEMGRVVHDEGSWEKGIDVMNDVLPDLSVDVDHLVIRDGSGISHDDLVPPSEISKLLYHVQTQDWFDAYLHSLPVAGESERMVGGTLRERMEDVDVQAKTGTINGVSSLSGYVETKSGEKIIFSILLNHLLDDEDGPPIEDKIMEAIANHES